MQDNHPISKRQLSKTEIADRLASMRAFFEKEGLLTPKK